MNAYLIDPKSRTITAVDCDYKNKSIQAIYDLCGWNCFDCVRMDEDGNTIYVDDNGLIDTPPSRHDYFMLVDYPQPLAGTALILGSDDNGDTQPCTLTLEQVRQKIKFLDRNTTQMLAQQNAFGSLHLAVV